MANLAHLQDLQSVHDRIEGGLWLVVAIEQQWFVTRSPGILVGDTPNRN